MRIHNPKLRNMAHLTSYKCSTAQIGTMFPSSERNIFLFLFEGIYKTMYTEKRYFCYERFQMDSVLLFNVFFN